MKLKTEVHVNLDLHFTNDDLANGDELARLAAVVNGLRMLIDAQAPGSVSQEPALPQLVAQAGQIEAPVESASWETPPAGTDETSPPPAPPLDEAQAPYRQPASRKWSFQEFDRRVRAEMKRLAGPDGVMPSTSLWERERDRQLPTLSAVVRRYKCQNIPELAARLGLAPARGVLEPTPVPANGHHEPRRRL